MKKRGNRTLKFIDRYVGIPMMLLLSLFRWQRKAPSAPQKIGILATAAIGDTILLSALAKSLKEAFPNSQIFLFPSESNAGVAKLLEGFDKSIFIPVKNPLKAIHTLRQNPMDVLIDSGQWARINAFLTYFSKASFTIGFKTSGQARHFAYDATVDHSNKVHELQNFLNLALPIAPKREETLPTFKIRSSERKSFIVCHLKPSGERAWMKEWDENKWAMLVDHFTSLGHEVFLTGGPEDRVSLLEFKNLVRTKDMVHVTAGEYSLSKTMGLLLESQLCVSVNTGILHMAACLGVNLVGIHGPTNPLRWGPVNKNSVVVQSSLECAPCLNLGFDYKCPVNKCMQSISYEQVLEACDKFLGN